MIKAFVKWLSSWGEPKTSGMQRSITGEYLMTVTFGSCGGFSIKQTQAGLKGSTVHWKISQIGDNRQASIDLLKGEYDHCLTPAGKESLIDVIVDRMGVGGYYLDTQRNKQGTLDIIRVYWDEETYITVKQLIEER